MALTFGPAPLSADASQDTNYDLEGPKHKLFFQDFPRRVRAYLGDTLVLDTSDGKLLYETALPHRFYAPLEDFDSSLLERTDESTHCPFKGDASYWTITAGGKQVENSLWAYENPNDEATWLRGYGSLYTEKMDLWMDEELEVKGLRDPYHRVDVRPSSSAVTVRIGGEVVARSEHPLLVSETAIPNRFYLPRADVSATLTGPTETSTHCPYKGDASYWSVETADGVARDVAWSYEVPHDGCIALAGHLSFDGDGVSVEAS